MTTKRRPASARKPLQSSADPAMKDLQVDMATADKKTSIHSDSIASADPIDRSGGHALYRSKSSFIFLLQMWADY